MAHASRMAAAAKCEPGGAPASEASLHPPPGPKLPPDESTTAMADNTSNFAASPYPVYNLGGNGDDDSVQHAILTSHAGSAVERNQDAQFSAGRDRALTENVFATSKDNAVIALENRVDVERSARVSDRHRDRQFAELKAELSAMRAEGLQRDLTALRADLAETKAASRASASDAILLRIAAKLGA